MEKKRKEDLRELKMYIEKIDKEISMVLQNLQWDQKHLLQAHEMVTCSYDTKHSIPLQKKEIHEEVCKLRSNGYSDNMLLLPEPLNHSLKTYVKFDKNYIGHIIENAAKTDPTFKKGVGSSDLEPMSVDRLQSTYTVDERRAIYNAVLATAPTSVEPVDFTLPSGSEKSSVREKTKLEILAEQRDMKRRRAKYRVATKSKNYSQVLREVINNQMELYAEIQRETSDRSIQYNNVPKQDEEQSRSQVTIMKRQHEESYIEDKVKNKTQIDYKEETLNKRKRNDINSSRTICNAGDYVSNSSCDKKKDYKKDKYSKEYSHKDRYDADGYYDTRNEKNTNSDEKYKQNYKYNDETDLDKKNYHNEDNIRLRGHDNRNPYDDYYSYHKRSYKLNNSERKYRSKHDTDNRNYSRHDKVDRDYSVYKSNRYNKKSRQYDGGHKSNETDMRN